MKSFFHSFYSAFKRPILIYLFLSYFFLLMGYPIIRSSIDSITIEALGAKSFPELWFYAIILLSIFIWFCNLLQKKNFSIVLIFNLISSFLGILAILNFLQLGKMNYFVIFLTMFKEVYIVILVHFILGHCNEKFNKNKLKLVLGPIGAVGGLGGFLGGQLTAFSALKIGTSNSLLIGAILTILSGIIFFLFDRKINQIDTLKLDQDLFQNKETKLNLNETENLTPLKSVKNIKLFTMYLSIIIFITQFVVNFSNYKFNLAVDSAIPIKDERTAYLGNIYSYLNLLASIFQLFIVPVALYRIKNIYIQFFFPLFYLILIIFIFNSNIASLNLVSLGFILVKALDYSLFSMSKELFYTILNKVQKYGVKYIADMFSYRFSKGIIALLLWKFLELNTVKTINYFLIFAWIIILLALFKEITKIKAKNEQSK